MCTAKQADIRGQECSRSDSNFASIEDRGIEIDKNVFPEFDVSPVINPNGRLNPWVFGEEFCIFFLRRC